MMSCKKLLLVILSLNYSIHGTIKEILADDESTHRNKDAMIEVACTIYSVLNSCSTYLDSCGKTCERFGEKCKLVSVGSKYFPATCNNETMSGLLSFLRKGSPVKGSDVTWAKLKGKPEHIVNYVMTNLVRWKIFRRMTSKIRLTISSIHSKRPLKKESRDRPKQQLKLETVIDLSCLLFTMTKSCSSQLKCKDNRKCQKISLVCDGLSSYSRYLSTSCNVDVIYDIMKLTDGVDERGISKDFELFWTEMFKSPQLFVNRVAHAMFETVLKDSSKEIGALRENDPRSVTPNIILRHTSISTTERTIITLPVLSRNTGNGISLRYSPGLIFVVFIVRFLWI